jgi:hypothetical protein
MLDSRHTVSDLIEALGGGAAVARLIGRTPSAVGEMKRTGSINVRYWPALIAAARDRGDDLAWVTSETLMLLHARPGPDHPAREREAAK